ncbi:MAG TPA: GNAT family N-acetyltransferase [Gaiellaceae bacterium]|nr:GNAT family N-acetyltransferase [Gaiellaceae bacterium]
MSGRVAFGETAANGTVLVELLEAGPDEAPELLESALAQLDPRPTRLEYLLDVPHPRHPHPDETRELLERLGFRLVRVTRRWEWRRGTRPVEPDDPLTYQVANEAELEDAVRQVAAGSLDRRLRPEDARWHAELLLRLDHEPGWYELASEPGGDLVGLVAAARVQSQPIVALVGVVPEQRGRGHSLRLVARATRHLAASGATTIRADSDDLNEPMARTFRRAGYRQFATRSEYFR